MRWLDPKYLWLQFLTPLIIAGWIFADRERRRRLISFGDPVVLGVPWRIGRRSFAFSLLVLAFSATTAVLPVPLREQARERVRPTLIEILLDARLFDSPSLEGPSPMDAAEYLIRAVTQMAGPGHIALYRAGDPVRLLVPATSDAQGLLIVMGRLRLENPGANDTQLFDSVRALLNAKPEDQKWQRKIIVMTPDAREDQAASAGQFISGLPLLWVRLASEDRHAGTDGRSERPPWVWSDDSADLREFFAGRLPQEPEAHGGPGGPSYVQYLAGLGFFALLGEMLLGSYARSKTESEHGG